MNLESRKIQFIHEFLKYANPTMLTKFEEMLKRERELAVEKEIKPMTLNEYEKRITQAIDDVKNNRVTSVRNLKKEIATWK